MTFFLQPSVTPQGLLERCKALAVLVLFVGRRYYLRPIILWNAAGSTWSARRAIGTPQA